MSHTRRSTWCSLRTLGPVRRCAILLRGGMLCWCCGVLLTQATAQVDHVVPRARGGATVNGNLAGACSDCNEGRGASMVEVPPEIIAVLCAPVDLAAGRALALEWYQPWISARLAPRKPPRPLSESREAVKKRKQRQRRREERERAGAGLGGVSFPFGGAAP